MDDVEYHRLLTEFRERGNNDEMFRSALEDVDGKVDFGRIKSCAAFGTASGDREIEFVRRRLPNLRSFTAVEPDPKSASALRARFQDGQLPGVETFVVETSLESWSGADEHVDAVLLFSVLFQVNTADRKAFFEKLMSRYLSSGGLVVIYDNITSVPSGLMLLLQRLDTSRVDYGEMEKGMVEAGFRVAYKQDVEIRCDLSNPTDGIVKFIQLMVGDKFGESEVRAAIDDVFSQPNMHFYLKKMAVFTK